MAACGDRYWNLIRTSNGATPEKPYTGLDALTGTADPIDAFTWSELATELHDKANRAFKKLGEAETAAGRGYPLWNAAITTQNQLHEAYSGMGSWWTTSAATMIPRAIEVCKLAVCLLEQADDGLTKLGESTVVAERELKAPSSGETKLSDWILPIAFVAGIGYFVWRDAKGGGGRG